MGAEVPPVSAACQPPLQPMAAMTPCRPLGAIRLNIGKAVQSDERPPCGAKRIVLSAGSSRCDTMKSAREPTLPRALNSEKVPGVRFVKVRSATSFRSRIGVSVCEVLVKCRTHSTAWKSLNPVTSHSTFSPVAGSV